MRKTIRKALSIGARAARLTSKQIFSEIKRLKAQGVNASHARRLASEVQREARIEAKRVAKVVIAEIKHGISVARKIKNKSKGKKSKRRRK